jgi:GT2 family glycosyltransferase
MLGLGTESRPMVRMPPDLSVVIVNWNTQARLRACLASIDRHMAGVNHEVIVVDNASTDGSPEMVDAEFPAVRLVRNAENVGFGAANNQAMRMADGGWLLLLNSDTELLDDSVSRMFDRVHSEDNIGVAQCRLLLPDGRIQHSAYRFPSVRLALLEGLGLHKLLSTKRAGTMLLSGHWDYADERDVDWVAGAFMLLPRAVFEATSGFDERLFMYGEDLEWCQRIRSLGWRVRYYPSAAIRHFDHASADIRWGEERIALCMRTQRDVYAWEHGRVRAAILMAVRAAGAAVHSVYYRLRELQGGPRADAYAVMRADSSHSVRVLLPLVRHHRQ